MRTAIGSPSDRGERLVAPAHARGASAGDDDAGHGASAAAMRASQYRRLAQCQPPRAVRAPPLTPRRAPARESAPAAWSRRTPTSLERAADCLARARYAIALTGAGLSVESGIPPFRGPGGLWTKHGEPPMDGYQRFLARSAARRGRSA